MTIRNTKTVTILFASMLALSACATDFAIYEAPTTGELSKFTFVNASDDHTATLVTFDDGLACTGRRYIHFENEVFIPAGNSRSLAVAAGREFALFASLNKIEDEEYAVELGVTGSGPAPVVSRSFTSIGCTEKLSFSVEPKSDYEIVISGPQSSGECSVVVSATNAAGTIMSVETSERVSRSSRNETRAYCEPLAR